MGLVKKEGMVEFTVFIQERDATCLEEESRRKYEHTCGNGEIDKR
jgi:hypothetical protein